MMAPKTRSVKLQTQNQCLHLLLAPVHLKHLSGPNKHAQILTSPAVQITPHLQVLQPLCQVLAADDLCCHALVEVVVITEQPRVVQRVTRLVSVERLAHLGQPVNLRSNIQSLNGGTILSDIQRSSVSSSTCTSDSRSTCG
jgi:hypothetical protein